MKWLRRMKWMKISRFAIVACMLLSVAFAAFTFYGDKVGNSVINISKTGGDIELVLSQSEDKSQTTSRMTVTPPRVFQDYTFANFPESLVDGIGNKNSQYNEYMAYSFYLVNESSVDVKYKMEIVITRSRGRLRDAIRVMVIEGTSFSDYTVYGKAEENDEDTAKWFEELRLYGYPTSGPRAYPTVIPFVDDNTVSSVSDVPLSANSSHRYTVAIWIEGCDPQCNDDLFGDQLSMNINFYGERA